LAYKPYKWFTEALAHISENNLSAAALSQYLEQFKALTQK